jgi:hypothetical protein
MNKPPNAETRTRPIGPYRASLGPRVTLSKMMHPMMYPARVDRRCRKRRA